MAKEQKILNQLRAPEIKSSGEQVILPNYSVVAGAENVGARSLTLSTGAITASGAIAGTTATLTGDNSSADTAYVPMVLYNTDATPPTANTVPIGTVYIQYTA